ncbi:hypothetical protein ACLB2K_051108 [Fragaria x ananassa]
MGRAGERDLSHSSNSSTSRSRPPRVDEQQLLELQERYKQRLKESEERAQQISTGRIACPVSGVYVYCYAVPVCRHI